MPPRRKTPLPPQLGAPILKPTVAALGLTLGFSVLLFFVLKPYYMTNDDPLTTLVTLGFGRIGQQPSLFLINTNLLLAGLLKIAGQTFGPFNWYGPLLLLSFFASLWIIATLILSKDRPRAAAPAALIFMGVIGAHYFTHFEFTLVAFFLAIAGLLLFFIPSHLSNLRFILSGAALLLSALLRLDAALLAALALFPWVLLSEQNREKATSKRGLCLLSLLIFLVLLAGAVHRHEWNKSPAGTQFYPYVKTFLNAEEYRARLGETQAEPRLKAVGWDAVDLALYLNFDWREPSLSLDQTQKWLALLPPRTEGKGLGWIGMFQSDFMRFQVFTLLLLFLFARPAQLKTLLPITVWFFLIFLGLFYWMKITEWIVWPLFSFLTLILYFNIFFTDSPRESKSIAERSSGVKIIALLLWILPATVLIVGDVAQNHASALAEQAFQTDAKKLKPGNDHLYVAWSLGLPFSDLGVLGDYQSLKSIPVYGLNDWQNTPDSIDFLKSYGLTNPLKDIVNRENMFLILPDFSRPLLEFYIQDRLHLKPELIEVYHGRTFNIYQVKGLPLS
jgi:hypothetical protein